MLGKIKAKTKNIFSKKIPIPYPVMYGELLKNKTAIITGGNSGIGFEIAKAFVNNGASVIITGRNIHTLENSKKEIEKLKKYNNQFVKYFKLDIENTINIEENIDSFLKLNNGLKIDILVNNAGILIGENIGETKIEDFEKLIKINLEGTYFVSQYFYNYFKSNKIQGNILNVTSSSANRPAVKPYTISKQGEKALTEGMAKKFIKDGIVVNGIAPGPTATKMLINNVKETGIGLSSNPAGRYEMPEEVANISVILVSELGRMIIGDTIYITGGAGVITIDDINY